MRKKNLVFLLSLFLMFGFSASGFAAKVLTPEEGGDGFKAATLEESKQLRDKGAVIVACHSHTTDFMKGRPPGTIHITCLTPKNHEFKELPLDQVDFDVTQLPKDKNTPIVTYCASNTWWKSYHAARLAVANGHKNVYWMRDGIDGWKKAGYPVVGEAAILDALIAVNKNDFASLLVSEADAKNKKNSTFVDFRDKAKFDKGHIEGAKHVNYSDMFSHPMMEQLNKSNSLIIVHDVPAVAGVIASTLKMMDYPNVYILK